MNQFDITLGESRGLILTYKPSFQVVKKLKFQHFKNLKHLKSFCKWLISKGDICKTNIANGRRVRIVTPTQLNQKIKKNKLLVTCHVSPVTYHPSPISLPPPNAALAAMKVAGPFVMQLQEIWLLINKITNKCFFSFFTKTKKKNLIFYAGCFDKKPLWLKDPSLSNKNIIKRGQTSDKQTDIATYRLNWPRA